jgi:hypothetical protein
MTRKLLLIELNELNFDVVKKYVRAQPDLFPTFQRILSWPSRKTSSENEYKHLEPWIQWVSAHTGKTYKEHGVFRLGDIIKSDHLQIFEHVESAGFTVGAISPMNAKNNLVNPRYFIPDPWTETPADKSWWHSKISGAISQAVNDNASARLSFVTLIILLFALVKFARVKNYLNYINFLTKSISKSWYKSLFLDLFLSDLNLHLIKKHNPDFAVVFFNAGAHIQHHYFHNSPHSNSGGFSNPDWYCHSTHDPVKDMVMVYESILSDVLKNTDLEIIIATGLTQRPYKQSKFYYRLNDHDNFLRLLGQPFDSVTPLMTRDFVVHVGDDPKAIDRMADSLSELMVDDGTPLFNEVEKRGDSLFVSLTYPKEITRETHIILNNEKIFLYSMVSFVAVKNGMHDCVGFSYFTEGIAKFAPVDRAHVSNLYNCVSTYFGIQNKLVK